MYEGDRWGELSWDADKRCIRVFVDYDNLTAAEARDLASWLLAQADVLDPATLQERPFGPEEGDPEKLAVERRKGVVKTAATTNSNEPWEQLEAIFAFDSGATDSGIHDESLRQRLVAVVDAMSPDEIRLSLGRWVRDNYLSEEALAQRYGPEDVAEFLRWIYAGDYRGR